MFSFCIIGTSPTRGRGKWVGFLRDLPTQFQEVQIRMADTLTHSLTLASYLSGVSTFAC